VIAYGVPRATADIDVTVEGGSTEVASALADAGFSLRVRDVEAFVARTRVLPALHRRTGLPTDVVIAGPGLETSFLSEVRRLRIGRIHVPVISPEHLLVTKILAGRPKDLEDVRSLLRHPGLALDRARVRQILEAIEAAIGQADLVPILDRLIRE
jgi:hypothetical protein